MAPEYALGVHLTEKADVYSFGVVALEIVSGERNFVQSVCLLDRVCNLYTKIRFKVIFSIMIVAFALQQKGRDSGSKVRF